LPWTSKASSSNLNISYPRSFPLDISQLFYLDSEKEVITLKIPENKSIIEGLTSTSLSNDFLDYKLDVKETGKVLTISRSLNLKKTLVPADKVKEFQDVYSKIVAIDNKQIAMK